MKDIFRVWVCHKSIWGYALVASVSALLMIKRGSFFHHWYLVSILVLVPFYEWVVHKYILHMEMKSNNPKLQAFLDKIHAGHHEDPRDLELVFAPFLVGVQVPLSFFLLALFFGGSIDQALKLALIVQLYYMFYEWMHLAHHTESYRPKTKLGTVLKQTHTWHHYKNENYWWGVTSVLGDKLVGTCPDPKHVPRSHSVKDIHRVEENTL